MESLMVNFIVKEFTAKFLHCLIIRKAIKIHLQLLHLISEIEKTNENFSLVCLSFLYGNLTSFVFQEDK